MRKVVAFSHGLKFVPSHTEMINDFVKGDDSMTTAGYIQYQILTFKSLQNIQFWLRFP